MFDGFSQSAIDFLWGIRFNNNRDWFQAHKEEYLTALYRPMSDLSEEIWAYLREKRPDDGLICKLTRIYRDARRLYGRGPYKDHLWFVVERPSENASDWSESPSFWFELSPDDWSYGLGYWRPRPVTMAKLRAKISRDPAPMERLTRQLRRNPEFAFEAETYKRPRFQAPSELLTPWYRAKSFVITHTQSLSEELYNRTLVDRLKNGYAFLLPYYDWLRSLDAEPEPDLYERKRNP